MSETIQKRQTDEMSLLIENLKNIPIVQVSCERSGVGRATYYRWRKDSKKFANDADKAIQEGVEFVNEIAESQLLKAIKEGNITSVFYWLNHRHKAYNNKLEITGSVETKSKELTEKQMEQIKQALHLFTKDEQ
jgi:predicted DNA binding protein